MTQRRHQRWARARRRAIALVGLALMALTPGAGAHAFVVSSSPSAGARLDRAPRIVEATFSEPVDAALSRLALQTAAGTRVASVRISEASTKLALMPVHRLRRGAYRVRWHSVSADDSHTVDGAYLFSVAAPVPGPISRATRVESADGGWSALLVRSAFDAALIAFCGAVFCSAVLSPHFPGAWVRSAGRHERDIARSWRVTVRLGIAAVVLSMVVAVEEAARADGLSTHSVDAYLTADVAGYARLAVTVALVLAVLMARRRAIRHASVLAVVALCALVVGGHARSAHPPALALLSDVVHLAAAAVWIGGILQLAVAWFPRARTMSASDRRAALAVVLPRFGRLALPAFVLVVAGGTVTAATELPSIGAVWSESYGRVLIVKAVLVLAIASLSYAHAFRLRPRVIASSAYGSAVERRHWRLLAAEPPLGAGVIIAAAWLVGAGVPARGPARLTTTTSATAAESLSVAAQAGPYIITADVSGQPRTVVVKLRVLDALERPVAVRAQLAVRAHTERCGIGCIQVKLAQAPPLVTVAVSMHGRTYRATLPLRSVPGSAGFAGRLVSAVARSSRELRSVAIQESLGSGHGPIDVTHYSVQAPNRFAYRLVRARQAIGDTIVVGTRQWTRRGAGREWTAGRYGAGTAHFSSGAYLDWWTPYATHARLLAIAAAGGVEQADVATTNDVPGLGTVWLRLGIDLTHVRVLRIQMVTVAHFMTQTWTGFNAAMQIRPPVASRRSL